MIQKLPIFLLLLVFSLTVSAQPTVSVGTTSYTINPKLLGLNGRSTEGPSWTNNTFLSLVNEMNPGYVRYPAGTQGNQWDWKTGTFIASLGLNAQEIFTIPMCVNGIPAGCKLIYMVNMVLPTPQTGITFTTTADAHLATDATLTAKIADILNALAAFETAGHLPEVCELGNELYFTNVHAGVYANNPAFYLQHAKIIALAIKNKYPSIQIILCTTKGGTSSRDLWNNTVFDKLSSDSQLNAAVYGIVQHHYINETYGSLVAVTDVLTAKTMIDEGIAYVQEIATDYAVVPSGKKLWLTEYGATKASADGMWAAGLRTALMSLSFMNLGPKVDNLMWHHITDDPNVLNSTKNKLGPVGIAFAQLSKAMNGSSSYKKMVFSNMSASNVYAGLTGYKFFANGVENILILNSENVSYTGVNLSNLTSASTLSFAKQYWSATPYLTEVSTSSNVNINTSTDLSAYQINPFSITVFSKSLNSSNVENIENDAVKVFPTTFENELVIHSITNSNFSIYEVSGRKITSGKINVGENNVNTSTFSKGIHFVKIEGKVFIVVKI